MSESKLLVIQKKLQKFLTSNSIGLDKNEKANFRFYFLDYFSLSKPHKNYFKKPDFGPHIKSQVLFCKKVLQNSKKSYKSLIPIRIPKKRDGTCRPYERFVSIFLRYLNYLKISNGKLDKGMVGGVSWRSWLPDVLKHKNTFKGGTWTKSSSDPQIPILTRGYKGNTSDIFNEKEFWNEGSKKGWDKENPLDAKSKSCLAQENEFNCVFRRLAEQFNGTAEQKLYTQLNFASATINEFETVTSGRKTLRNTMEKINENSKIDTMREGSNKRTAVDFVLPPPQRCRLSCPLPPPGFGPSEEAEFLPSNQSPLVKFSSQPAEFLPHRLMMNVSSSRYKLDTAKRPTRPQNALKSRPNSRSTKTSNQKKVYPPVLKHLKSQLYHQQFEPTPKMKALLFEPESLALNFHDVDIPTQIYKDEVLVQVLYSGVCGTDFFITEGKMPCGPKPLILGHEISGKVYAAGSNVDHVKVGDNVTINPYTACCTCRYCLKGLFSSCEKEGINNSIGVSKNGGWAEFLVVKKSQVFKIPEGLGLGQAALIQPLSCVLSAMSKLNLSQDLYILIQGLGLAGCFWASVLHSQGHKNVFVSEKNEKRKQQFQALNLNYSFLEPENMENFKADVIIECTGSPSLIEKSLNMLNPNGQLCFFGKPNPLTEIRCTPYEIIRKEIRLVGNIGNTLCFSKALALATSMGCRYLDFDKLGIKLFDLEEYEEAFYLKKSGAVSKVMFKFDS